MNLIEVKPLERESWHGKKGKESFKRPVIIEPLINAKTKQYSTGLSPEDISKYSEILGEDLNPAYIEGKTHPFWNSRATRVRLENKTNIFDISKPLEFIKYSILLASDLVANSKKEYDEGLYPHALFVIVDKEQEVKLVAERGAIKRAVYEKTNKMTPSRKADIIQILAGESVRKQSNDYINGKLDSLIENIDPETVLNVINRDEKRTVLHAMILEAQYKNIIRKEGSKYMFMDIDLGFDIENVIDMLQDKSNQILKAQILEKLEN